MGNSAFSLFYFFGEISVDVGGFRPPGPRTSSPGCVFTSIGGRRAPEDDIQEILCQIAQTVGTQSIPVHYNSPRGPEHRVTVEILLVESREDRVPS